MLHSKAMLLVFISLLLLPLSAYAQCQGCAGGMNGLYYRTTLPVGVDGAYGCQPAINGCTFTGPCYWITRGRRATLDGPRYKLSCASAETDVPQQEAVVADRTKAKGRTSDYGICLSPRLSTDILN